MLQLSQSALAAFHRCRRRFYLRFVRRLEWPAPLTGSEQDWERSLRRGEMLHLLIQQHSLGIAVDAQVDAADDAELARWWQAVQDHPPPQADGTVHAELELAVPFSVHRLVARFDRLIVVDADPPAVHIVDWKTGRVQPEASLRQSWQTTVYRFVAVEAASYLTGGRAIDAESVGFTYWQAEQPESPLVLAYSAEGHEQGRTRLRRAIEQIDACLPRGEEGFERTEDLAVCGHCPYRSYCERGREAPEGLDLDEDLLDVEMIRLADEAGEP